MFPAKILVLWASVWLCVVQEGHCTGQTDHSGANNKQCNSTYYIEHNYQECPANGRVFIENNDAGLATTRVEALEKDLLALKAKVEVLQERPCADSTPSHNVVKDVVHKVTKPNKSYPADCTEIFNMGYRCTGVYKIQPKFCPHPFEALCDLSFEGWTVLMRRHDGSINFFRKWKDYKEGFGSPNAEHWMGNDNIHLLTNQKNYQLRVETTYWSTGYTYYTDYQRFKIESEANKYKLHVTGFSGISGYDGLTYHNNRLFSTWDKDNDGSSGQCAQSHKSAWWHGACHRSQLTGLYASPCVKNSCMEWNRKPLKAAIMKVKSI